MAEIAALIARALRGRDDDAELARSARRSPTLCGRVPGLPARVRPAGVPARSSTYGSAVR
jgi:hypothetical protein